MERNKYISKEFFLKIFILILLVQQVFMSWDFRESLKDYEFTYCWNKLYGSSWTHEYYNNISIGKKNLTDLNISTSLLNCSVICDE